MGMIGLFWTTSRKDKSGLDNKESQREAKPLLYNHSPSPSKERGIKGERLMRKRGIYA